MKTPNNDINVVLAHCAVSYLFSGQCKRPFTGAGLSHDLDRVHVPLPHVVEHVLHAPHTPQFPFTMPNNIYMLYINIDIQQYHNHVYF